MPVRTPDHETLLACLAVPRWADDVLASAEYASAADLLAAADAAARALTDRELDQALTGHPRIGVHSGGEQSQREQSNVDVDAATAARLSAGNASYERCFGRIFLIRAAGRNAQQVLAELNRRLSNDADTERAETVANLREIALLRLLEHIE